MLFVDPLVFAVAVTTDGLPSIKETFRAFPDESRQVFAVAS